MTFASTHYPIRCVQTPSALNPTSPLGVGGLGSSLFQPPFFSFGGGALPSTTSPGPGLGRSRGLGRYFLAQDGSKRGSKSPRRLSICPKRPQDRPKTAPRGQGASQRTASDFCLLAFPLPMAIRGQDGSNRAQEGPRRGPREPQYGPKDRPRALQDRRAPQEAIFGAPEGDSD
eukprot:851490-Pyramimonas_sp.AAC.1